jgi:Flp pilus assembly protein TadG
VSSRIDRTRARRNEQERGQSTVEFALVLPFLVLFLLGLVQVAVIARDQLLVVHAARAAAREASVGSTDDRVERAATNVLHDATVSIGPRGAIGESVVVTVHYAERTKVPLIGDFIADRTLSASSTMRVERSP